MAMRLNGTRMTTASTWEISGAFIDVILLVLLIIFMVAAPLATVDVKVICRFYRYATAASGKTGLSVGEADNTMFIGNDPVTDDAR